LRWISDRTLCYLASGKAAVIEHTGPSRYLPDAEGLLRFRTPDEAVAALDSAYSEYSRHCKAAQQLAEAQFDAAKVTKRVLERLLNYTCLRNAQNQKFAAEGQRTILCKRIGNCEMWTELPLHWGSGSVIPIGWIHSDVQNGPGVRYQRRHRKGWFAPENRERAIYFQPPLPAAT
jgi:hypothetical protein